MNSWISWVHNHADEAYMCIFYIHLSSFRPSSEHVHKMGVSVAETGKPILTYLAAAGAVVAKHLLLHQAATGDLQEKGTFNPFPQIRGVYDGTPLPLLRQFCRHRGEDLHEDKIWQQRSPRVTPFALPLSCPVLPSCPAQKVLELSCHHQVRRTVTEPVPTVMACRQCWRCLTAPYVIVWVICSYRPWYGAQDWALGVTVSTSHPNMSKQ